MPIKCIPLSKGGHLAGVLFNKVFEEEGPSFGGTMQEYTLLFEKKFSIKKMELCYNSIEWINYHRLQ